MTKDKPQANQSGGQGDEGLQKLNEKMATKGIEIAEISDSADQMEKNINQIMELALVGHSADKQT